MTSIGFICVAYNALEHLKIFHNNIENYFDQYSYAIDDRTNDNSFEYLKNKGYNVNYFTCNNNFSNGYNKALEHINTDWVFQLDSDEKILTEDILKIKNLIDFAKKESIDTFRIPRNNWLDLNMERKKEEWYPDFHDNLFEKKEKFYKYRLHVQLQNIVKSEEIYDIHIQHFNLCDEICSKKQWERKNILYRKLEQMELEDQNFKNEILQ